MKSELEKYITEHIDSEDEILRELYRETYAKTLNPRMMSGHWQGLFLTFISKMVQPTTIVEIGTFTGYASICLAKGLNKNGTLHTIEINDELVSFASSYFRKAGLSDKIIQHVGDARNILNELPDGLDIVFIDGDKEQYPDYYHSVLPKVRPGGIILADNVLWNGKVIDSNLPNDRFTKGIIAFNSLIKNDDRIEKTIVPLRDGVMLIRKK